MEKMKKIKKIKKIKKESDDGRPRINNESTVTFSYKPLVVGPQL